MGNNEQYNKCEVSENNKCCNRPNKKHIETVKKISKILIPILTIIDIIKGWCTNK